MSGDLAHLADRLAAASGRLRRELPSTYREIGASVRRALTRTAARTPRGYRSTTDVRASETGYAVETQHPAAEALERGGTIQGRPWIAVPVSEAARATGDPRHDGSLVAIRARDGRLFLLSRRSAEIRWRLVQSVQAATERPIGRALDAVHDETIDAIGEALLSALEVR